jgi:hypothetical protein
MKIGCDRIFEGPLGAKCCNSIDACDTMIQ